MNVALHVLLGSKFDHNTQFCFGSTISQRFRKNADYVDWSVQIEPYDVVGKMPALKSKEFCVCVRAVGSKGDSS